MRRSGGLVALLVAASALSACQGLEFTNDNRLSFTGPRSNSLVSLPVTVSWTMKDAPAGATYAVFVDRAPIKVGSTLESVVPDSAKVCGKQAVCPSDADLAVKQVYRTTQTSITLTNIIALTNTHTYRQRHEVTVVLLDGTGRRLTESAWLRRFDLRKKKTTS